MKSRLDTLEDHKLPFAKEHPETRDLLASVKVLGIARLLS